MFEPLTIAMAAAALLAWRWWGGRRSLDQVTLMRTAVAVGGVLVDVRSPGEFAAGHAACAKNIPLGALAGRSKELGSPDTPVVVCCASGARSRAAKAQLERVGFTSVMDLGPWRNWNR